MTKPRKMPVQKPGKSRQDYGTPREFIDAVDARFGPLVWDLAAGPQNTKCEGYYTRQLDAFSQHWHRHCLRDSGFCWLNPPFAKILPWVEKAVDEMALGARVLMLAPAAISTKWFQLARRHAHVIELAPRVTFEGERHPYVKDLVLCCFAHGLTGRSFWRWNAPYPPPSMKGKPNVR